MARVTANLLAATALTALIATMVHAQQTAPVPNQSTAGQQSMPATQEPMSNKNGGLEEIVVTARKTQENEQRVPIAISTVTAQKLKDLNVRDITEVQKVTPGLYISAQNTGGRARLTIRGQGEADSRLTTDGSVGVYIDGVPLTRSYGLRASLIDLAQVEVLKGPQGTLFGKNTTGGALNITTQHPTYELGGYFDATLGNYDDRELLGVVNLPIIDNKLAIRAVGQRILRDGFGENGTGIAMGNDNLVNGRLLVRADPTETVNVLLSADYARERSRGGNLITTYTPITANAPATSSGPNSPTGIIGAIAAELGLNPGTPAAPNQANLATARQAWLSYQNRYLNGSQFYGNSGTSNPIGDYRVYGFSGQFSVRLGQLEFKSITAWRHVDQEPRIDYDGTPFTLLYTYTPTKDHNFSQEFQLNDIKQHGLDWQIGAFYNRESGNELSIQNSNDAVATSRAAITDTDSLNKSIAVYGQATYYITQRLRLTGGVRYTDDYRGVTSHNRIDPSLASPPFPAAGLQPGICTLLTPALGGPIFPNCGYETHVKFSRPTYLGSLDYRPINNIMLYASTSRGYRAGGYSASASSSVSQSQAQLDAFFTPFAPETVTNYEVGFKTDFLNRKLRVNGAFYYQDYKDIQVQIRDLVTAPGGSQFSVTLIRNAAKARLYGGELEIEAAPTNRLRLDASTAYLNAKYTTFFARDTNNNIIDLSAQPFAAPKWTANVGGSYTLPLTVGDVRLSLNYAYQSKVYFRADTPHLDATAQTKYGLLDGRLNWHINDLNLDLSIWGKNLTNKRYLTSATNLEALGYDVGFVGAPRQVGVEARKTF